MSTAIGKAKTTAAKDKLRADFTLLWPPGADLSKGSSWRKPRGWKVSTGKAKGWSGNGTLGVDGKPAESADFKKVIAKGRHKTKELTTTLNAANKKFTDNIDGSFAKSQADLLASLNNAFDKVPGYKEHFVYEAATGNYKFGDGSAQAADYMLSWAPVNTGVQDFTIHIYDLDSVNSSIIGKYASAMNVEVSWKSSSWERSKKQFRGYNLYQAIRIGLGQVAEEKEHTLNILYEEIEKLSEQLDEGYLAEWKFYDKIKVLAGNLVSKIKDWVAKIKSFFTEAIEKIKEAAGQGLDALGAVLGFEMDVSDTLRNQTISI